MTTTTAACRACGVSRPLRELLRVDGPWGESFLCCRPSADPVDDATGRRHAPGECFRRAVRGSSLYTIAPAEVPHA